MSFFTLVVDEKKSSKNLSLKNSFNDLVEAYRQDQSMRTTSPLGSYYGYSTEFLSEYNGPLFMGLTEEISEDPDAKSMKKSGLKGLYKQVINGDNFLLLSLGGYDTNYDDAPITNGSLGTLKINLGQGDDIIDYVDRNSSNVLPSFKKFKLDAGDGSDIVNCGFQAWSDTYQDYGTQKAPKAIFKGGNGEDIFYGVPRGIEVVIKDFNTEEDSISLNGKRRRYGFYETSRGVAMYDKRHQDGLLLLEGVASIDSLNITNESVL